MKEDNTTEGSVPITFIIAVKNEEKNIADCLKSIDWADQIFVVDSQSNDNTVEISSRLGATVVQFYYDGKWPKKRNWSLDNLQIDNEWVFLLDADERVTSDLKDNIESCISQNKYDGFYVKWKFIFLNKWMKHSWSHGWMLRMFRHKKARYEDLGMRSEGGWDAEVHENIILNGHSGKMPGLLDHNTNQNVSFWIQKQNEFSDWNAVRRINQLDEKIPSISYFFSKDEVKIRKFIKSVYIRLPFKPVIIFIYLYIVRLGFLDGKVGLYFCSLRAMHELNIQVKIFEINNK